MVESILKLGFQVVLIEFNKLFYALKSFLNLNSQNKFANICKIIETSKNFQVFQNTCRIFWRLKFSLNYFKF